MSLRSALVICSLLAANAQNPDDSKYTRRSLVTTENYVSDINSNVEREGGDSFVDTNDNYMDDGNSERRLQGSPSGSDQGSPSGSADNLTQCPPEDCCKNCPPASNPGNKPTFYTVCKAAGNSGNVHTQCLPQQSGQFDFVDHPNNYCGECVLNGSGGGSVPTAAPTASPTDGPTAAPTAAPTDGPTAAPTAAPTDDPTTGGGFNSDPIILGLQNQVFKFEGRNGAWYSNLSSKYLQWNMLFKEFDTCPKGEDMFVSGLTISLFNDFGMHDSDIMIATTQEPTKECQEDPNAVCLGDGTLHISFDGGKTFVSTPGDYHYSLQNRVVAHNTYAACSRKWHDYNVSPKGKSSFFGTRRATTNEKKPLQLLSDKKLTMIDPEDCGEWIDERLSNNDLFQQRGQWSTLYIETPLVSFHVEYRRSDWLDPKCDYQSLDAWMTKVSDKLQQSDWGGVLGETKHKVYDVNTGEQIMADRNRLLRGRQDADYEVENPYGTKFDANVLGNTLNKLINSMLDTLENSLVFNED